ncbi:MAG: formate dehydrogenase-N subunit alpha [Firmicutes bacterium HGW-Firmicutes-8]|nr:MAG: formate dehydrogenase-N subunit alpha [Firmicutes bacterium HGW-Firmicutes-8]
MTNSWTDLQNTDCALILGGNPAENHPMSFKWLTQAREKRGAKIIHIDPRFTRTSSKADIYARLRPGTDIVFMGGMFNYILQNNLYNKEYVLNFTNAAVVIVPEYKFEDGLFSGYDPAKRKYSNDSWKYQKDANDKTVTDPTLQNPLCVLNIMKKHYSRYDIDTVCRVTGMAKEDFLNIVKTYAATAAKDKSGVIMYAMGTTQHTVGSQNVRADAILQLLLGNVGIPGGGVAAMRGESNVQGSTDYALLFHLIPGYLNCPKTIPGNATLAAYNETETVKTSYWVNKPKFLVSYLKAMWGPKATAENEFAYHYLPKYDATKNYSFIALFEALAKGVIKGMFAFGMNPSVGGPNTAVEAKAMENLDWLVAVDLFETETAAFWKAPGVDPKTVNTEVFMLPACGSYEKEGSISTSGRMAQWRWKAVEPKGEAQSDLEIIHQLALKMKAAYAKSAKPEDAPIRDLFWNFGDGHECDIDKVVREINGYETATGKLMATFGKLMDDGSTCSGNWIYSGMYPAEGKNLLQRRDSKDTKGNIGIYANWAFAWPVNRRIIYNRASADPAGVPWSKDKAVIWWDPLALDAATGVAGKWVGYDVPDFKPTTAPDAVDGVFTGNRPFIMRPDGLGGLFANMNEGPLPEHYEPWDTPLAKNPFSSKMLNPVVKVWRPDEKGTPDKYPIVATTYRVCEHWQTGIMTRNTPWLAELFPTMFIEIGEELAEEKGIKNSDKVVVESARGKIECHAMVTKRFKPYEIDGKTVHIIGMPWHYGYQGIATGAIANYLTPHIGDGNTMIPEYKAFLVNVRRAG